MSISPSKLNHRHQYHQEIEAEKSRPLITYKYSYGKEVDFNRRIQFYVTEKGLSAKFYALQGNRFVCIATLSEKNILVEQVGLLNIFPFHYCFGSSYTTPFSRLNQTQKNATYEDLKTERKIKVASREIPIPGHFEIVLTIWIGIPKIFFDSEP